MSECISSFFGFISNLNPIKQVTKSGKKRAIFRCIFTIFTLLEQNNIRSILRVECTDVKIGRHANLQTNCLEIFIFLCPDDSNCCASLNHNSVVSLTLVRLHARLLCAGPPASLTDERSRKIVNISLKCAKDIRLFTVRKIFTSITNTYYGTLKYIQKRLWTIYE